METYRYPVTLAHDDDDTFLVTFPDFPEAQTFGETKEEALEHAVDALATVIDAYISDRRDIPAPSPVKKWSVMLPALMATKVGLYVAMREQKIGKAELARRLRVHLPQVDRLLNVRHGSQLGQLEAAFGALGQRLEISIVTYQPNRAAKLKQAIGKKGAMAARLTARRHRRTETRTH